MYTRKENESQARKHLEAFWNGSSLGRPALSLLTLDPRHTSNPYPIAGKGKKDLDFDPEFYAHTAKDCFLGGDYHAEAFPFTSIEPGNGLALTALAAGGTYHVNGTDCWIEERKGLFDEPPPAAAKKEILDKYAACVRAATAAAGDMGFISQTNLLDPVTTVSQMAGAEEMCMALYDRPEKVKAWIDAVTRIWLELAQICAANSGAKDSHIFFGPVTQGAASCLQCDFAVTLSPEMFAEFVMPVLHKVSANMTNTLYHLDGVSQMRFLDQIAKVPNCKGIQWNPETDYYRPTKHLEALKEIRARGMCRYLMTQSLEEAIETVRVLGPDGLFIGIGGFGKKTREDAEAAIREIERASVKG